MYRLEIHAMPTAKTIASLFQEEPTRWGLRGDPHLWQDMRATLARHAYPSTEKAEGAGQMLSDELLTTLLTTHYAIEPQAIALIGPSNPDRLVYHVSGVDGQAWLLRIGLASAVLPAWIAAPSMERWMQQQATLLDWCAHHAYPAPLVRSTQQHTLISTHAGWHGLLLEFVAGTRPPATPLAQYHIAARLGLLHHTGRAAAQVDRAQLPQSWWSPLDSAIARAQQLFAANMIIPAQWDLLIETCQTTLQHCRSLSILPETLIHGDCWLGNAIAHAPEEMYLIDWEYAGWGITLLDLGSLLSDCFAYPDAPAVIDTERIAAVMAGYQQHNQLSPEERDALPLAIQFGSAFLTAIRCQLGSQTGWSAGISRGLRREQARLAISAQIAAHAQRSIPRA